MTFHRHGASTVQEDNQISLQLQSNAHKHHGPQIGHCALVASFRPV